MSEFDPAPRTDASPWPEDADTFDRVYDVALGLTTATSYADVADLAECSPNAAKKHLDRLTEMGVVRADTDSRPTRYSRNDGYLEWQEASRIARELTIDEIVERVRDLEAERAGYEERFDATDPDDVSVVAADHGAVHERMATVSDWQAIDRDIRLYELARQLAQNDGHIIPA